MSSTIDHELLDEDTDLLNVHAPKMFPLRALLNYYYFKNPSTHKLSTCARYAVKLMSGKEEGVDNEEDVRDDKETTGGEDESKNEASISIAKTNKSSTHEPTITDTEFTESMGDSTMIVGDDTEGGGMNIIMFQFKKWVRSFLSDLSLPEFFHSIWGSLLITNEVMRENADDPRLIAHEFFGIPDEAYGILGELHRQYMMLDIMIQAYSGKCYEIIRVHEHNTAEIQGHAEQSVNWISIISRHVYWAHSYLMSQAMLKENMIQVMRIVPSEDDEDANNTAITSTKLLPMMTPAFLQVSDGSTLVEQGAEPGKDGSKLTPMQICICAVLEYGRIFNLRYRGNDVYEQIKTSDDEGTHAWRPCMSLNQLVVTALSRQRNQAAWRALTQSDPRRMREKVVTYIQFFNEADLPLLVPSRFHISFRNGIWFTDELVFKGFDDPTVTDDIVSFRYIDIDFDTSIRPQDPSFNPMRDIHTPSFERILNTQSFSDEVKEWVYMIVGRMFYPLRTYDQWQKFLVVLGDPGTGKSTLGLYLQWIMGTDNVAVLSSNCEPQYALSTLMGKYIWICFEMKRKFQLDNAEFQSITSGDFVSAAVKFKDPKKGRFDSPGCAFCNELPASWQERHSAIPRRLWLLLFRCKPKAMDGHLFENLKRESPAFIAKCTLIYRRIAQELGERDADKVGPAYFRSSIDEFNEMTNALTHFIKNHDDIKVDKNEWVSLSDFRRMYNEYFQQNNSFGKEPLNHDLYRPIFKGMNPPIKEHVRTKMPNGTMGTWFEGIGFGMNEPLNGSSNPEFEMDSHGSFDLKDLEEDLDVEDVDESNMEYLDGEEEKTDILTKKEDSIDQAKQLLDDRSVSSKRSINSKLSKGTRNTYGQGSIKSSIQDGSKEFDVGEDEDADQRFADDMFG